ncbi:ABC transporter ATP-binding protein [Thermotoga profunda]|uniref:ABC transporter ATP-binding protein n=1 Tax=Thermotoga profunda TaxID=1508420 RepID=UPI0005978F4D|nr:ABC transporter ATP-binding protein [Thermotoga profunda]
MNFKNIRKIFRFYSLIQKRFLILILVGGFLATFSVVLGFFIPLLVRDVIDGLTNMQLKLNTIYLLGIVYGASFVLTYVGDQIYLKAKYRAVSDLSSRIFNQSFFFPWQKLKQQGSAYYATLINHQLNEAFFVLDYGFFRNALVIVRTIFVLVMVFMWSKIFFILFVANAVIVGIYLNIIGRVTERPYSRMYELLRRVTNFITETFENIHEVLAGGAQKKRQEKCKEMYQEVADVVLKAELPRSRFDKVMIDLPEYFTRLFILIYGAYLVIGGKMTVGTIWALWNYFSFITEPLYMFRELARITTRVSANLDAVLDYFNEVRRAEEAFKKCEIKPISGSSVYELVDVTFGFEKGKSVLKQINFYVQSFEITAIVGLSGEGKSTLLNILLGLEQNYEGMVKLFGNDLKQVMPSVIFEHVAFYSQNVGIFNDTLENNIVLGREYNEEKLEKIIKELGIEHLRGRKLGEGGSFVSGGEKQRIQFARLFYANKPVVILDEPLTNLDTITEKLLLEKLVGFLKEKTAIMISHKPNIIRVASKIIFLENGKVSSVGRFEELMQNNAIFKRIIETYVNESKKIADKDV